MAYNSYFGIYDAKLDPKCRIVIPQSFRNELGEEFRISLSFDGKCLYIMDNKKFNQTSYRLSKLSFDKYSKISRMFHAYAFTAKPDKQGRIVLPPQLRKKVNMDVGSQVNILGLGMYIEVWLSDAFDKDYEENTRENLEELKSCISLSDEDPIEAEDEL